MVSWAVGTCANTPRFEDYESLVHIIHMITSLLSACLNLYFINHIIQREITSLV